MKKGSVKPTVRSRSIKPGESDAGARFAQKRSVPRYPFSARVTILEPITRSELSARTSDISLRGCYIESIDQLPKNTIIRICIEQAAARFETWGRVAHVQVGSGSGIAFFETSAEQQRTMEGWITEISEFLENDG
ncbi:MAG: PilZ domain-containing protein [Candidatus Acidiferrales bacterium]